VKRIGGVFDVDGHTLVYKRNIRMTTAENVGVPQL
jgi:hypothetical protein